MDSFGRVHNNLRISVTDRCNIRCFYCMPAENVSFLPRSELLTFEEIVLFVRAMVPLGIDKLRITGGEPLVRSELHELIQQLGEIRQIRDIALTTNGILLSDQAVHLRSAGLNRLNISIDSLNDAAFEKITRRKGLARVLEGIRAAIKVGFDRIRLNAVSIAGLTEEEIVPLTEFAHRHHLEMRFIEFMPLDAEKSWSNQQILSGRDVLKILQREFGTIVPENRNDPSQPAVDYRIESTGGTIGLINPVTEPFCSTCNRLRLTAEGQLRNCLFSTSEWDARKLLRSGSSISDIQQLVRDCVLQKKIAHGVNQEDFERPKKAMFQIGG